MKLLSKSDISKAKSVDRQREVEEGSKLASKVDALRELSAKEEVALNKFRVETLSTINSEILSETTKRDELKQEVRVLEDRKVEALKPLTEELTRIAAEREHFTGEKSSLEDRKVGIQNKEVNLEQREQEVAKLEKDTSYAHADVREKLQEAGTLKDNAERLHRVANDTLEDARIKSTAILATATQRETWVAKREKTASIKEEELRAKEIELAKEWSQLKDREATLERNIKRNKNYGI